MICSAVYSALCLFEFQIKLEIPQIIVRRARMMNAEFRVQAINRTKKCISDLLFLFVAYCSVPCAVTGPSLAHCVSRSLTAKECFFFASSLRICAVPKTKTIAERGGKQSEQNEIEKVSKYTYSRHGTRLELPEHERSIERRRRRREKNAKRFFYSAALFSLQLN